MKTTKIALLLLLLAYSLTFSLELSLGVKGGLNIATMQGVSLDSMEDLEYKKTPTPAFTGGVALKFSIKETVAIQSEILVSMQGCEFTKEKDGIKDQMDVEYTFLAFPILFKKEFPLEKSRLNLIFGGAPSLNLSSNFEMSLEGTADPEDEYDLEFETKEMTAKTDMGIVVGIGSDIYLGKGDLTVELRHTVGVRDSRLYGSLIGTHNTSALMVGYQFNLKRD